MQSSRILTSGILIAIALVLLGCSGSRTDDESRARIRLLNVSSGYDSLDLYVSNDDSDDESLELEGVDTGTISEYAVLDSDTYTIKLRRNGVTSTLYTLTDVQLTDSSHVTVIASGPTGGLVIQSIDEDEGEPDSGDSVLGLINAAGTGALDVYLTDEGDSLEDATPVSSGATLDSGTYRLRVTTSGDHEDLRLDLSGIELESEEVATFVLASSKGGVLVNGYFLPQQGDLTAHPNSKARIRGAVGLASGSSATLRINDQPLFTNASPGVIGNVYWQVDAGSAEVELSVSGTPVAVPNQVLEGGGDYTFLILDDAGTTQTSLIDDDNTLPSGSSVAKLRMLNGLSGLGASLTLTVDFFPIIEAIPQGVVSGYSEVDGSLEYQYDVSDADTTVNVWSRESIELQTSGVYTLFMSGSEPTVNGSLRRDR